MTQYEILQCPVNCFWENTRPTRSGARKNERLTIRCMQLTPTLYQLVISADFLYMNGRFQVYQPLVIILKSFMFFRWMCPLCHNLGASTTHHLCVLLRNCSPEAKFSSENLLVKWMLEQFLSGVDFWQHPREHDDPIFALKAVNRNLKMFHEWEKAPDINCHR